MTSIEKLKMVVNSFDSGDVLVKNNSTTLFHTSYKDNGFGQFFYDNYVSTTKMVETKTTIKENDTMKMPNHEFRFWSVHRAWCCDFESLRHRCPQF